MSVFEDMVAFYKAGAYGRGYIVTCASGASGIGKTAAAKQATQELKDEGLATGKMVTIIASQILPNEVSGITMPVAERHAMEIYDHYRLSTLQDGDVLFFDELLEADQLVLSACLTLIESRELMSGRKMPDIIIMAATNPSIEPHLLKENIRQRFVWKKFDVDKLGCRQYIRRLCGYDIGTDLMEQITDTGNQYNVLTPRSMTKMAKWITEAGDDLDKLKLIAHQIDTCWGSSLGSALARKYSEVRFNPKRQALCAIREAAMESGVSLADCGIDLDNDSEEEFENADLASIMQTLQELPEWEAVKAKLMGMQINDGFDEDKVAY